MIIKRSRTRKPTAPKPCPPIRRNVDWPTEIELRLVK